MDIRSWALVSTHIRDIDHDLNDTHQWHLQDLSLVWESLLMIYNGFAVESSLPRLPYTSVRVRHTTLIKRGISVIRFSSPIKQAIVFGTICNTRGTQSDPILVWMVFFQSVNN
jgi:hypothetical protein